MAEETSDKFREVKHENAAIAHDVARDDKDTRTDRITAKLLDMVDHLQHDVLHHMKTEEGTVRELKEDLRSLTKKVDTFLEAFPEGDAVRHRLAHEAQIIRAQDSRQFWKGIKMALAVLVLTGVASWIAIVVWKAFLLGPK